MQCREMVVRHDCKGCVRDSVMHVLIARCDSVMCKKSKRNSPVCAFATVSN